MKTKPEGEIVAQFGEYKDKPVYIFAVDDTRPRNNRLWVYGDFSAEENGVSTRYFVVAESIFISLRFWIAKLREFYKGKLDGDSFVEANILHSLIFNGLECLRILRRYAVNGDGSPNIATLFEELEAKIWTGKELSKEWNEQVSHEAFCKLGTAV